MSVYFYSGLIFKSGVVVRGFSGTVEMGSAGDAYRHAHNSQVQMLKDEEIYSDEYFVHLKAFNKVE